MNLRINDKAYETEALAFLKVFYPLEEMTANTDEQPHYTIQITVSDIEVAYFDGKAIHLEPTKRIEFQQLEGRDKVIYGKKLMKNLMFKLCGDATGIRSPWGILIGIRPTKLASKLLKELGTREKVIDRLTGIYCVTRKKAEILMDVVEVQNQVLDDRNGMGKKHSIYIHVPFCPSRCSYCSFTSYSKDKCPEAYESYANSLVEEISAFRTCFDNVRSVYIGGGTPTSLRDADFEQVIAKVREFLGEQSVEFTVEAGRPDSITQTKLNIMKRYGVSRISINPQTIHDSTLKKIGREHTFEDVLNIFSTARDMGFDHINMDLILGLPGETVDDVEATIKRIIELNPESITIHTMALKRGTTLTDERKEYLEEMSNRIDKMLNVTQSFLADTEYTGYYLYRQKNMVGNFENVGYCKAGKESLYNIHTMEEVESIIAFGAGAISKRVEGKKIKRFDQPRDVRTYEAKVPRIIEDKWGFLNQSFEQ